MDNKSVIESTDSAPTSGDIVKKALNVLFKGLDSLFDFDESDNIEKVKEKDVKDGDKAGREVTFKTGTGAIVKVVMFPTKDNKNAFDMKIMSDGCNTWESEKPVAKEDIKKKVENYLDKNYDKLGTYENDIDEEGNDTEDDDLGITSSKKLQLGLRVVAASNGSSVELTAINCNYQIKEALVDLDNVLSSEDFIDMLTEEPQAFEITVEDDEYNVDNIDEVDDTVNCYFQVFRSAVELYHNLQAIHWGARGDGFYTLHEKIGDIIDELSEQIDWYAELVVEKTGVIPHIGQLTDCECIDSTEGFDINSGFLLAKELITTYINVIDTYYVNFDADIQSTLDDYIREMRKTADYFISRQQLN